MMKKTPPQIPIQTRPFAPARNSQCLCGSGKKFKHCCADNLPGFDIGEKIQASVKINDYKAALIASRSDITQYTIWHKTNTAPQAPDSNHEPSKLFCKILKVDVEALSDYVESLSRCYERLNRNDEFPAVLERLRSNIDHPCWHRKIIYLHALQAIGKDWDREAGKKELKKLGSMDEEVDVEILQLYLDLFYNKLSFSERQIFTDRVIDMTEDSAERLHYQCISAANLLMVDDLKGAAERLQSAIQKYKTVRDENNESAYALNYYASACEMLGKIQQDKLILDEAIILFRRFVTRDDLSMQGIANAYRNLGDALSSNSLWQEAKVAYNNAFEYVPDAILKVLISNCLLCLNKVEDAKQILSEVEVSTLTESEINDYIFTFSQIAIESGNKEDLISAEQKLRSLKIIEPYFKQYQSELLISVIGTLRTGPSQKRTAKTRGFLHKALTVALRYTLLEPNFFGLGFKVGKILEDISGSNAPSKEK